jgi:hypothetical protein
MPPRLLQGAGVAAPSGADVCGAGGVAEGCGCIGACIGNAIGAGCLSACLLVCLSLCLSLSRCLFGLLMCVPRCPSVVDGPPV